MGVTDTGWAEMAPLEAEEMPHPPCVLTGPSLCACLGRPLLFLQGQQSYAARAHPSNLIPPSSPL